MISTRIYIAPTKLTAAGQLYSIHLGSPIGEYLTTSRTPFYDGARALLFRGITGRFEMHSADHAGPRLTGDVERCAGLRVEESDKGGLKVRRWNAFPVGAVRPQSAIEGRAATILPAEENA